MSGTDTDSGAPGLARVETGVPGLDAILHGGLLSGGLYIIQGLPGTGKTVLANQIIFHHTASSGRAIFITVLGENHARMMLHLGTMRFFDIARVPDRITYIGAYSKLEEGGLAGLLTLIRREAQARRASLIVLDGLSAVEARADSEFAIKRFAHELQTLTSMLDCTMLLLTTAIGADTPERTMVDGIIELGQQAHGPRNQRGLVVYKFRGSSFLEGLHPYRITSEGLTIFPRTEALLARPSVSTMAPRERISSGIPSLDRMFQTGIPAATVLAVSGPPGSGKTTLGLHFLSRSTADEPGLLFGCYETPERLRLKAASIGFDLPAAEASGSVELLWFPLGEHILDELAFRLLDSARRRCVKRLVIDGLSGFEHTIVSPERFVRFWSTLSNELRALGVTTIYTMETPEIISPNVHVPVSGVSSLAEAMILLRYLELNSRLHRLISLLKSREGAFDPAIRQFTIGAGGIEIGQPFDGIEAVLSGTGREAARPAMPEAEEPPPPDAG